MAKEFEKIKQEIELSKQTFYDPTHFKVPFCKGYREDLGLFRYSDLGDKRALPIYAKKRYIIVDLTKFVPTGGNELERQWLEIFKNAPKAKCIPANVVDEIRDVYERLLVRNSTRDFLRKVVNRMHDKREYWAGITTARRRGEAEGFAKGEAKGFAKGEAKGEAKGFAKGFAKVKTESIKLLRLNGASPKLIAAVMALKAGVPK